jgi:hypothetical protein
MLRNSPTDREPAPSETTALSASVSAAAWSISSPPTDRPKAADALRVDVRPSLEERDGRLDVLLALPAGGVRVALALALSAAVEEEHRRSW